MKKILTEGFFYSIICLVFSRTQRNARVAQLVERDLAKVEAAGSSPVSRFFYSCKAGFFFISIILYKYVKIQGLLPIADFRNI